MAVITQPAALDSANYAATLAQPYDLRPLASEFGSQWAAFLRYHPSGHAHLWAGRKRHRKNWERMRHGDLVLFIGGSQVHTYAYVTAKLYLEDNDRIWPRGEGWDYIYAVDELTQLAPDKRKSYDALGSAMPLSGAFYRSMRYHPNAPQAAVEALLDAPGAPQPPAARSSASSSPVGQSSKKTSPPSTGRVGRPTRGASFRGINPNRDVFVKDWEKVERGNEGHQRTLDALIQLVRNAGLEAMEGEKSYNFDLAWEPDSAKLYVCEVKSLTDANERHQIRLGLGQVLDYATLLAAARTHQEVVPVLLLEREPHERSHWSTVCSKVGVTLTWPTRMAVDLHL